VIDALRHDLRFALLASLLFGVSPTDPATFLATAAALAVVAGVASLLPALRAVRTDPVDALRSE
jgi:ABC-type lipoprotein release transport system permease subunit